MTDNVQTTLTVSELLTHQLQQMLRLETLLHSETDVLQRHQPNDLLAITEEKKQLLESIQSLDITIGKSNDFATEKATGSLNSILEDIEQTLAVCRELNTKNGMIIHHSQSAVERMKSSLLDSHNKNSMTYDNKGKKNVGLSSKGIKA